MKLACFSFGRRVNLSLWLGLPFTAHLGEVSASGHLT
jgi:hypothetical protein